MITFLIIRKCVYICSVFSILFTPPLSAAENNPLKSIEFISITHSEIWVKDGGLIDSSIIVYEVRDSSGSPVTEGVLVKFILNNFNNVDSYINPVYAITNSLGRISTVYRSGQLAGLSQFACSIDTNNIRIISKGLLIKVLGFTSKVKQLNQNTISEYALNQNYPNPFNPSTTISYYLEYSNKIILEVVNVLGERVAILDEGVRGAGYTTINWNAKVPSGIYYYRLVTSNGNISKKMLLLK